MVVEEVRTGKKTLSLASARRYPAAKDSDSVARTLLSNAHSDGGNPEIIVSHPPEDVKALYQGGDDPRASLSFSPDHPGFNMKFFEKADLSSFLHETSHMFLERMARDVEHPDAPQQLKDDFQAILTKLGAKDYASLTTEQHEAFAKMGEAYFGEGKAPSPELQGAFTRFSLWLSEVYRKMKTYFSDVKLSDDVRGVFDRLLATDEEIAAARKQQGYQPLFATAEDMGVSKAEFDAYAKMGAKDMQKAHDKLLGDMLKEKTRETTKWWKEALDKKKEEVTAEAQQEPVYQAFEALTKGKEFNGEEFPVKMDRQALVDMYGEEFVKGMPRGFGRMYAREGGVSPDDVAQHFGFSSGDEMLKRMMEAPRMKDYVRDEAARRMDQEHGNLLTDGSLPEKALEAVHNDEHGNLLRAELKVLKRKASEAGPAVDAAKKAGKIDADQAKREADYNARWKEAESKLSLAIERGAKQAEINDLKAQASAAKKAAQQGRKYVKDSIPPAEYFKSIAAAIMAGKRERDIMPQIYARAESKASREAFEAAGKQDWGAASEAKFKELLNHYLYKEAADTRDEVDKMYRYLVKAGKLETLQRVGKASQDMLSQVRGILDRYELVKVSNIELQNRESLAEYLQRFSDEHDGREIPVDERLLDPTYRANYRDVPVDELRGVYDSVKSIMHVVQAVNRVRSDQRAEQLHDVQEQMAARIHASKQNSAPDHLDRTSMTGWEKAGKTIGGLFSGLERMELNVFGRIDGGPDGPMHDFIWNPLLDGQAKFNDLLQQVLFGTVEMLDRMPKEQAKAIHDPAGIYIKSLDRSFSRSQLIGLAMHFGSDSNFDKVTRGGYYDANNERGKPLSADAVAEITRTLTKADWDLVQHVWDQMAKLKPHMAELEKRWNGLEPEWVELRKVVTPYGTYDGGYFPMVYASEASRAGEQQVNSQEEFNLKQYADSFSQASTKRGHLIARTEAAYQVSTDWQNITTRHLNDVITDIAYREPIYQANRILSGLQEVIGDAGEVTKIAPVKAALVKMYGKEMPLRLQKWLQSIVSYNSTNAGPGASDWERAVAFTRSRATAMHISYKITNAFAESVNAVFLQAWQQLDIKNIVHGALAATVNSPGESWQFALDNSQYYQHIEQNVNQNFVEAMNRLTGKHDVMSTVFKFGMELKAYFYKMQAVATFTGAYKQGMEQMYQDLPPAEAHQRAARFADSVIRTTNEAGSAMDLSPAESNPIMRNFTQWMGPVIVNLNQYINAVNTAGNEMDVAKATGKAAVTGLAQATPLMMRVFIGNYLANAILFPLLQGKAPAIGEDADKWRAWLLAKISTEWSAGIPIVREVGKGLESHITGEPYHLSSIPMLDMAKDMKDLPITALKYEQGNATGEQLSRAATNAGGWALGLPSSQMNITGKFIYDVLTGNYTPEHPWSPLQDILYRRKKH